MKTADRRRRRHASSFPTTIFGIEPNVAVMHQVVTAQLAAKRAGHAQHQDPRRSARRRRQAVAPEGHRPRPPGFDPLAAVARRRRGARPQAARLLAAHAQEDGAPRVALARSPTAAPRSKVVVVDDWGDRRAEDEGRASSCSRRSGCARKGERDGRASLVVLFRTDENVWKSLRNLGERVQIVLPEELNTYDVLAERLARVLEGVARDDDRPPRRRRSDGRRATAERRRGGGDREGSPRHHHQAGRVGEVVRGATT